MTKSFFITMLVAILIGAVLGNFLFEQYKLESETVIKEVNSTYFLMEGSYSTEEQAKKAVSNIEPYLIVKEDVITRDFEFTKVIATDKTGIMTPEANVEFGIYDITTFAKSGCPVLGHKLLNS